MDATILAQIKQDLLKKKEEVEQALARLTNGNQQSHPQVAFPNYGDESDDNAQEVNQYSTDLEADRILEKTLNDINKALAKIEQGVYGICQYCQQPIEEKRLLIRPFSSSCVKCKNNLQNSKA